MPATTIDISQEEPILFRVRQMGENPLRYLASGLPPFVVEFEYVNKPGRITYGVQPETIRPHGEALFRAMLSQDVYWVDLDYSKTPAFPLRPDDTTLDRFLRAVANGQIVAEAEDDG